MERAVNGEAVLYKVFSGNTSLNMYHKELPVEDMYRVALEYSDQQSEYDPGSDEEEQSSLEGLGEASSDLENNTIKNLVEISFHSLRRNYFLVLRALATYQ